MPHIPVINFRQMEAVLIQNGFYPTRQNGSHVFYRHEDGRTTTVPHHKGKDLSRPLTLAILRDIQMSSETFIEELKK